MESSPEPEREENMEKVRSDVRIRKVMNPKGKLIKVRIKTRERRMNVVIKRKSKRSEEIET